MTEFLFFTQPLALFFTMLLPLLWLLFRLFPLRPRRVVFPALVLFGKDKKERPKPRDIPLWLKLMRLFAVLLFILALAHPVYDPNRDAISFDPTLIVMDNSWAAAASWPSRVDAVQQRLDAFVDISRVPISVITTAPDRNTGEPVFERNLSPDEAKRLIASLTPEPWPSDYKAAGMAVKASLFESRHDWNTLWFSDGQGGKAQEDLLETLSGYGQTVVYEDSDINQGLMIKSVERTDAGLAVTLNRHDVGVPNRQTVSVLSRSGEIMTRKDILFEQDMTERTVNINLPEQVANDVGRVKLSPETTAATVWHMDGGWQQPQVGIWTRRDINQKQDYLNDAFYIAQSLRGRAKLSAGGLDDLLGDKNLSMIILPDSTEPDSSDYQKLSEWVENGGILLRFAGPNLAEERGAQLLPVDLYGGERSFGGAMSWEEPARVSGFAPQSPLAGLQVSDDLVIRQQVLARPSIDLNEKRWAWLEDQTPLITHDRTGQGGVVLVHTTADISWSDLVLSDVFPLMMASMADFSEGGNLATSDDLIVTPSRMIDANGRLTAPGFMAAAENYGTLMAQPASPSHPPGLYTSAGTAGETQAVKARNLGQTTEQVPYIDADYFDHVLSYKAQRYFDLSLPALILALLLFLAEMIATAVMTHGAKIYRWRRAPLTILAACLLMAATTSPAEAQFRSDAESKAVNKIDLAYVITGDTERDRISRDGLNVLGQALKRRTTVEFNEVVGVNPEEDDLTTYPVIYWPMITSQSSLSEQGVQAVQYYLDHGGMIFFDTRDAQYSSTGSTLGQETLQRLTEPLDIGPLVKLEEDHVLTRAYYLLTEFPGLYDGSPVWVEDVKSTDYDGVPSVVIGAHDWAAAWSRINPRRNMVIPGKSGAKRRQEMALRFGVNLTLTALTGSYKTDQVHIKFILERFENDQ
ncbi:MAG: DUF4159 domain-containing protein [Pseudomonadota bacterium]